MLTLHVAERSPETAVLVDGAYVAAVGPYQELAPGSVPPRSVSRLVEAARALASSVVLDLPCTFDEHLFETLAVASIFVFRRKLPPAETPRPYRCRGYPLVPAAYILIMGLDSRLDQHGQPLPQDIYDALHAGDETVGGYNDNVLILLHLPGGNGVAFIGVVGIKSRSYCPKALS